MFVFCLLLSINIVCFVLLGWIWYIIIKLYTDKHFRECPPYVPSVGLEKKVIIESVSEVLKLSAKQMIVVDPGCGFGGLIITLAKRFPEHKFVGIEWGGIASKIAKIRTNKLKNTQILKQDFFDYDFSKCDIIVCFLMDSLMKKFGEKIKHNHKETTQIIFSNSFEIPGLPLIKEIKTGKNLFFKNVYIYKL